MSVDVASYNIDRRIDRRRSCDGHVHFTKEHAEEAIPRIPLFTVVAYQFVVLVGVFDDEAAFFIQFCDKSILSRFYFLYAAGRQNVTIFAHPVDGFYILAAVGEDVVGVENETV